MVGDGSYLMLNSEIATSVMLGMKLVVVVLDNRGFGCINRLQQACGGAPFNNLFEDCVQGAPSAPAIDFAAHAIALGARAENVANDRRARGGAGARARVRPHVRDLHRDRSRSHDRRRRLVVGRRRARSVAARERARSARALRARAHEAAAVTMAASTRTGNATGR